MSRSVRFFFLYLFRLFNVCIVKDYTLMIYLPAVPYRANADELVRETDCHDAVIFRTDRRMCLPFADVVIFDLRKTLNPQLSILKKAYRAGRRPSQYQDQVWIGLCYEVC